MCHLATQEAEVGGPLEQRHGKTINRRIIHSVNLLLFHNQILGHYHYIRIATHLGNIIILNG
jgi:hypothetical protein